jgi:glutamate racemase
VTDQRPIGVFDSGVGGLTVLREILRRTPDESTIYFGDNARAPYGTRPDEEVRAFSTESIDVLVDRDVKAVVAAATRRPRSSGDLRRRYDLPILGVIRPGATSAALATRNRRVGVIGTPATIRSHAYFAAIKDENPAVEVYEHATPTFVPMVEAGLLTGSEVEASVREALAPLLGERDASGEFVFPLPPSRGSTRCSSAARISAAPRGHREVAGDGIAIVDSAAATASALRSCSPSTASRRLRDGRPTQLTRATSRRSADRGADVRRGVSRRRGRRVDGGRVTEPGSENRTSRPRSWRSRGWRADRRWQAGFILGSAIGAAATVLGRRAERIARRGLVDWGAVERIAIRRAEKAPGGLSALELKAAEGAYREAMARVVPRLSEALGTSLPGVVDRASVVDRPAGSGPTSARSGRSSRAWSRTSWTRSCRRAAASPAPRWRWRTGG